MDELCSCKGALRDRLGIWKPPKPRHSLGFPFYRLGGCRWRSLPTRWLILATAATCWAKPVLPRPYLALEHLCAQVGMMTIITCPPELWERHPDHDKTMMGKSKGCWGQEEEWKAVYIGFGNRSVLGANLWGLQSRKGQLTQAPWLGEVCVYVCVWSMFSIVAFLLLSGRISPSFSSPG